MLKLKFIFITWFLIILIIQSLFSQSWIRINQLGYLPSDIKVAVLLSKEDLSPKTFHVCDVLTDKIIYSSIKVKSYGSYGTFKSTFRLDFSTLKEEGAYYLKVDSVISKDFRIAHDVYDGTADFLLRYMRQQRCGYNPILQDSCHKSDGFIIYHPTLDSTHVDVIGGWHDASDYLQYVTTSANAVFQMLFAYQKNPETFTDDFDKDGHKKANEIPDILDEAKWGIDWLLKMNPEKDMMFNQIADDRDHKGFRLPNEDTISYGKGLERPVYLCTGKPQGIFKYKNRADGIASTAGKYASAFALGAEIFEKYFPDYSAILKRKSVEAYEYGKQNPGVCQTASCLSPYFYEEDNWTDDMELAASVLYSSSQQVNYLNEALFYRKQEPITPWMGADTANHYQWYPFVNLGHYYLASFSSNNEQSTFINYLKQGIEKVFSRGKSNPFLFGVPFIWCSNNLVAALLTQCKLYQELADDSSFLEMEASLRDWLFGCNPWGTSMIIGLPENGDYPEDPHSAFTHLNKIKIDGGLVDGPVYTSIYKKLIGIKLYSEDEYEQFQSDISVYHDDYGDYSTNESTMDGTASLIYYLSALQNIGNSKYIRRNFTISNGGIVRTDNSKKQINLVFAAHEFADGYETIKSVLNKHDVKASFFFTGDFYRNEKYKNLIKDLISNDHYLGAHSDKHILYASWENRDSTLITKSEFLDDIRMNYLEMEKFGISKEDAKIYLPPYEWYNQQIKNWSTEVGLNLVCHTGGTYSNHDWTYPELGSKYLNSQKIIDNIFEFEAYQPNGLNGFILLMHLGTDERRTDKLYNRLDEILTELEIRGYSFTLLTEVI
jgi:peptidoglycan/xylan/chitin deacetylase (PgdA/CDA1 family)